MVPENSGAGWSKEGENLGGTGKSRSQTAQIAGARSLFQGATKGLHLRKTTSAKKLYESLIVLRKIGGADGT